MDNFPVAYEGTEPYIFISYSHKDSNVVFPAIRALQEAGYPVWYDAGIQAGSEWPEYIASHLVGCKLVVAFISKNAIESSNCRQEINFALSKKKNMLSVRLDDFPLSDGLQLQLNISQMLMAYMHKTQDSYIRALVRSPVIRSLIPPIFKEAYQEEKRKREAEKKAEEARIAEEKRKEAERRAEEQRQREEARRIAEAERRAAEKAEQERLARERSEREKRQAEERIAAEKRRAEETRLKILEEERRAAELRLKVLESERLKREFEIRIAEEKKKEEARKRAEELRVAEELRRAEEARIAEERRKAEAARIAEERRKEEERKRAEEAARKAEEERILAEARKREEARLAEERRKEEARRAEERKQKEEELERKRLRRVAENTCEEVLHLIGTPGLEETKKAVELFNAHIFTGTYAAMQDHPHGDLAKKVCDALFDKATAYAKRRPYSAQSINLFNALPDGYVKDGVYSIDCSGGVLLKQSRLEKGVFITFGILYVLASIALVYFVMPNIHSWWLRNLLMCIPIIPYSFVCLAVTKRTNHGDAAMTALYVCGTISFIVDMFFLPQKGFFKSLWFGISYKIIPFGVRFLMGAFTCFNHDTFVPIPKMGQKPN